MSLADSMLSSEQTSTLPPIPVLVGPRERNSIGMDSGFFHGDLHPQPTPFQSCVHPRDTLRLGFSFYDLTSIGTPHIRPEHHVDWPREPEPLSLPALFESMVRQLLARDNVAAARRLLRALPSGTSERPSLRRLRVLLSEPRVQRRSAPRPGASADLEWLKHNASAYLGQWVAVAHGALVDADPSLEVLLGRLRQRRLDVSPLLHRL